MKMFLKTTSFIGFVMMNYFWITYAMDGNWENALCWFCSALMLLNCSYSEWRVEEAERFQAFLIGKSIAGMSAKEISAFLDEIEQRKTH